MKQKLPKLIPQKERINANCKLAVKLTLNKALNIQLKFESSDDKLQSNELKQPK